MDDERTIDDLINSIGDDDAPDEDVVDEELEDQEEDTSDEVEEDDEDDESGPDSEDDEEDDDPGADEDDDEESDEEVTPPSLEDNPAFIQMQEQIRARDLQLQHYFAQEQQREQARIRQDAEAKLAELEARWNAMDPEDAAREKLAFQQHNHQLIVQGLQQQNMNLMARQQAMAEAQAEEAAKPQAILKAIEYHGLSESDFNYLFLARSGDQLEEMAVMLKEQRREQTKSARKAKAKRLAGNPALVGSGGGKAPSAPGKPVRNLDDFVDNLLQ